MDTKTRGWVEVLIDLINLIVAALATPKGLELLDELADLMDLPFDPFPNVDGLSFEDDAPETAKKPSVQEAVQKAQGQPDGTTRAFTAADMKAARLAQEQANGG